MSEQRHTKRLRVNVACKQCRTAKRRCEGGHPCSKCSSSGVVCESPIQAQQIHEPTSPSTQVDRLSNDLPLASQVIITTLIDRYFTQLAPHWKIIERSDLNQMPYTSPLLLRSICLMSAHLGGANEAEMAEKIAISIQQCSQAYELLCLPMVSSLQSILLLIVSPLFTSSSSILVASACRMALALGLHQRHHPRPELYWTCIMATRWHALRESRAISEGLCFDLDSALPYSEPGRDSLFGGIYHLLAKLDLARSRAAYGSAALEVGTSGTTARTTESNTALNVTDLGIDEHMAKLLSLLADYLEYGVLPAGVADLNLLSSSAFEFRPFHDIREVSQ